MRTALAIACALSVTSVACEKKKPAPAATAPTAAPAPAPAPTAAPPAKPATAPAPKAVKPIPDGFHALTPAFTYKDAAAAIEWYKKVFGAIEVMRMPAPGGKGIMHAEVKIGDSILMMGEPMPGMEVAWAQGNQMPTGSIMHYVTDVDAVVAKFTGAGGKLVMPVQDMFWGDRYAHVIDPFGHHWGIATHKEDVPPAEMKKRGEAWAKEMMAKQKK